MYELIFAGVTYVGRTPGSRSRVSPAMLVFLLAGRRLSESFALACTLLFLLNVFADGMWSLLPGIAVWVSTLWLLD